MLDRACRKISEVVRKAFRVIVGVADKVSF